MNLSNDSFESDRLIFEARREAHAKEVYDLFCDKELYLYTMRDIPPSEEWLADGFRKAETKQSPDGKEIWLGWFGRDKITMKIIGLFETTIIGEDAYVAYTVFRPYQNNGYAFKGTSSMINYVSNNYHVKKFIIEMDTRNRVSFKVAEKLGFEFLQVKNNVTFLKGFVSHEFQFQKLV